MMVFLYFPFAADSDSTEFSFLFNSTFSFNSLLFATLPQESRPFRPLLGCLHKKYYFYLFIYIYIFFFCNYERREGPKCRNTREADRIQDLRACFIKTKAEWHKKIKHEIQKKNKNESKGQKDKVATNSMKTQGTKTRKTPQGDTGRLGNRLRK